MFASLSLGGIKNNGKKRKGLDLLLDVGTHCKPLLWIKINTFLYIYDWSGYFVWSHQLINSRRTKLCELMYDKIACLNQAWFTMEKNDDLAEKNNIYSQDIDEN